MKALLEHSPVALRLSHPWENCTFHLVRQLLSYLKYRELDQRGILKPATTTKKSRKHSIFQKDSPESPQSNAVLLAPLGTSPCIPKVFLRCFPGSSHSCAMERAHGLFGGQRNQCKKRGPGQADPSVLPYPSEEGTDLHLGSQGRGFVGLFGIRGASYFS